VVHPKQERHWAVDGTPADAVIVALHRLLPGKTGFGDFRNQITARNMGENVYYSGTVGAAREAALHHNSGGGDVALREKRQPEFLRTQRGSRVSIAELI